MIAIPKKLTILGHTIKVRRVKVIPIKGHSDDRGLWVPDKNLIYIVHNTSNPDLEEQTFYHELIHAILDNLSYNKLSNDEVFVDRLGSVLHQAIKTMEYQAPIKWK